MKNFLQPETPSKPFVRGDKEGLRYEMTELRNDTARRIFENAVTDVPVPLPVAEPSHTASAAVRSEGATE